MKFILTALEGNRIGAVSEIQSSSKSMEVMKSGMDVLGQMDEVINIAHATKGTLGAQRTTFTEIQGKVKQLGDRFPAIRGVLGMSSFTPVFILKNEV